MEVKATAEEDRVRTGTKVLKMWWQMKIAERMGSMASIMGQNQLVRRLVKKNQDGTLGKTKAGRDDDEMGDTQINVGDSTHHHYETPGKGRLGTIAKLAIGAGLLGTGAGASIAIPMLANALKKDPPTVEPVKPVEPIILPGEIRDWKLGQPIVE